MAFTNLPAHLILKILEILSFDEVMTLRPDHPDNFDDGSSDVLRLTEAIPAVRDALEPVLYRTVSLTEEAFVLCGHESGQPYIVPKPVYSYTFPLKMLRNTRFLEIEPCGVNRSGRMAMHSYDLVTPGIMPRLRDLIIVCNGTTRALRHLVLGLRRFKNRVRLFLEGQFIFEVVQFLHANKLAHLVYSLKFDYSYDDVTPGSFDSCYSCCTTVGQIALCAPPNHALEPLRTVLSLHTLQITGDVPEMPSLSWLPALQNLFCPVELFATSETNPAPQRCAATFSLRELHLMAEQDKPDFETFLPFRNVEVFSLQAIDELGTLTRTLQHFFTNNRKLKSLAFDSFPVPDMQATLPYLPRGVERIHVYGPPDILGIQDVPEFSQWVAVLLSNLGAAKETVRVVEARPEVGRLDALQAQFFRHVAACERLDLDLYVSGDSFVDEDSAAPGVDVVGTSTYEGVMYYPFGQLHSAVKTQQHVPALKLDLHRSTAAAAQAEVQHPQAV